jgi:hypothetical protein
MAQGPSGRSYATVRDSAYAPCPEGTTAVQPGQTVELAAAMATATAPARPSGQPSPYRAAEVGRIYLGIGEGGLSNSQDAPPLKVCAAGDEGGRRLRQGEEDLWIHRYDTLYLAAPDGTGGAIDVFIDDRLWQTVRW